MDRYSCYIACLLLYFTLSTSANGLWWSNSLTKKFVIKRDEIVWNEALPMQKSKNLQKLNLKDFIWSTCSSPNAAVRIKKLKVSEPLSIPGNATVSLDSSVAVDLNAPLQVSVKVQRKVSFLWVDVPCVNNVGSCNYQDLCSVIPFPPEDPCPEPFASLGISCRCPFPKGDYVITDTLITIPDEHIPEYLVRGQYNVRVEASMGDQEVLCFKCTFSLA